MFSLDTVLLGFITIKAQKQKMTAHRYTTGTGASMRQRESSPTRPCLPTDGRQTEAGPVRSAAAAEEQGHGLLLAENQRGVKSYSRLSG